MASEIKVDTIVNAGGDNDSGIDLATNDTIKLNIAGAEKARMDSSGNLLVGKTSQGLGNSGVELREGAASGFTRNSTVMDLNRTGTEGQIVRFRFDGSSIGHIGTLGDRVFLAVSGHGVALDASGNSFLPTTDSGGNQDNFVDIGASSARFDDVFATNTSITDSDENKKQNIAPLTDAEINAGKAISKLFKTYKWKDKVVEKGSNARIHTGVIAQQVQTAMSDAGLDASKYAFWCSDTYWEKDNITYNTEEEAPKDASKITRLSLRYVELLAFIGAATEQRLASIEARLTALESK